MVNQFCIDSSYSVKPLYEISENKFYESDKEWSTTSGAISKVAMGLANLYSVTKQKKYLKYATKICDKSILYQNKSGRFLSFPFKGGTNLHPHCYSAEGLWEYRLLFKK